MPLTIESFFDEARRFAEVFDGWSNQYQPEAVADHICYKCASPEEFETMRRMFESNSAFLYQSIISNRRIAVVKLKASIETSLGPIWFLELSDQKPDGSQKSEFDHVEIYPKIGSMIDLAASLEAKGVVGERIVRPHHTTFDVFIEGSFKVRLEDEALVEKIKREEM